MLYKQNLGCNSYHLLHKTTSKEHTMHLNVSIQSPIVTRERFSEMTDFTSDTIRGMISRDQLPSLKLGHLRLINIAAIDDAIVFSTPLLSIQGFSKQSGLATRSIENLIYKGNLPFKQIGRRKMVDICALLKQCSPAATAKTE